MKLYLLALSILLATALILDCRAQPCAAPENPGPYQKGYKLVTIQRGIRVLHCRLYYPATTSGQDQPVSANGRPFPIIAFGHGFSAQNTYYNSYYEHLASWGYVTIAPQFPDTQHGELANDLLFCLHYLRQLNGQTTSVFYGTIDTTHAGVSGHSMGGGASLLAASSDARVLVAAPLAPAETSPSAISAMSAISGAVCLIAGSADGITPPATHQTPMYNASHAFRSLAMLQGGNHTRFMDYTLGDFLDPNGNLTRPDQQLLSRRYMTAIFNLFLRNDTCGWNYSYGSLSADSRVVWTRETTYLAPLPFALIHPILGDPLPPETFRWQRARSLNPRDTITYTLQLAASNQFSSFTRQIPVPDTSVLVDYDVSDPGPWIFWRVIARNSPTTSRISSNYGNFIWFIPIELVSLSATRRGHAVQLAWSTASEKNNRGFHIERSQDAGEFQSIGWVDGNGTTTVSHRYSFIDPCDGPGFYRLRQMDFDGSSTCSPIVEIGEQPSAPLSIGQPFPNPLSIRSGHELTLPFSLDQPTDLSLLVHDARGSLLYSTTVQSCSVGEQTMLIPLPFSTPGMYIISLRSPGRIVSTVALITE